MEVLVAMAVCGVLMTGLMTTWASLSYTGLNTTAYATRQNEQMRVLDYVKRDICRATALEIYNGATLLTSASTTSSTSSISTNATSLTRDDVTSAVNPTFGTELRLTMPGYYSDTREEDNAIGTKTTNQPTITEGTVTYGTPITVRYYTVGGAVIRKEGGTERTIASATGAFAVSFNRETSGAIRCRVFYDQPMRGGSARTLRRQVDTLCIPRFEYLH